MKREAAWRALVTMVIFLGACSPYPSFDPAVIAAQPPGAGLPASFTLGVATAAHQVEGNNHNDWSQWEDGRYPDGGPHIRDDQRSGVADDSWARWPEDVQMVDELRAGGYRLSIEWSRLQPAPGEWNAEAADNYRAQLLALRQRGITPWVTLFHFTLPLWVAEQGGWEWSGALDAFEAFCARAAAQFGDLVDDWVTVNEPSGYSTGGYALGTWPPGAQDMGRAARVFATLMHAHGRAAAALKANDLVDADGDGRATFIGLAQHVMLVEPATGSALDVTGAGLFDDYANEALPRAVKTGRITLSVPGAVNIDEPAPELVNSFDYLGINFYFRVKFRGDLTSSSLSNLFVPQGRAVSDLGADLYPEGLYQVLTRFKAWGWPLVVTENGVADASDALRPDYLRGYLYAVSRAIADGADVRGYFHWSLMDNFEWSEGFSARFGLYAVDFDDPLRPRTARPSAEVFRQHAAAIRGR